jgi:hypothetical protein
VKYTAVSGRVKESSALTVVVLPEFGGSAATIIDAPRSIATQKSAATRESMFPAAMSSVIDIGVGGSQCQPHQLVGLFRARMTR